ncbi:DUF2851 family protein [Salinibacter sp.]|uniref:DUF2851 family protein n=1 Tax=Salinibacter sp. TaxID=2065818 RepID=UPI002FC3ADA4
MPTFNSPSDAPATLCEPSQHAAEVPEALVQDLWAQQRFDTEDLSTSDGAVIDVIDPGRLNSDAGPDFQRTHVRIGGIEWRGPIEVHTTSGGWFRHEHHTDPRYNSVVLHVTLRADMWTGGLLRADESPLPELVLYPCLDTPLRELLYTFRTRADDDALPCAARWDEVPPARRTSWMRQLAGDRMTAKRDQLPDPTETSLDRVLHERLFAGLGYAKNDAPMTTLARRTPPSMLRSLDTPTEREALLLGTAGLLPTPGDLLEADRRTADYAMALRDCFQRLQVRLDVTPMAATAWSFFRLRPNNFPPLRIAQAAAWYAEGGLLHEAPISTLRTALGQEAPVAALREALTAMPPDFWHRHYHLTKRAAEHDPSLGTSRRDTLLVNAVVPVLLRDAEEHENAAQAEAALDVLRALPPSQDHVVRRFQDLGTDPDSAYDAQGLHELYREYCSAGGCLECQIGQYLLDA